MLPKNLPKTMEDLINYKGDEVFVDCIASLNESPCLECVIKAMCERRFYNDTVCPNLAIFYNVKLQEMRYEGIKKHHNIERKS